MSSATATTPPQALERVMIAGGGTGGHVFPALAIAQAILQRHPGCQITFVGAVGGMEVGLVENAGFTIETLTITGFYRTLNWRNIKRNLMLPFRLMNAMSKAKRLLRQYRPQVVVGVGGYASYPLLKAATAAGIPSALQEQNAFPGLVNRKLGTKVQRVFLGNAAAARFFAPQVCLHTGNPLRGALRKEPTDAARRKLNIDPTRRTLAVLGGSLGARTVNEAIAKGLARLQRENIQVLWQCGKQYADTYAPLAQQYPDHVRLLPFVDDMAAVYNAADLVVARAGALTVSELLALHKPSILVPSPNVADDHQTHNARSLVDTGGALMVADTEAGGMLVEAAINLLRNAPRIDQMAKALAAQPAPNAALVIVKELEKLAAS